MKLLQYFLINFALVSFSMTGAAVFGSDGADRIQLAGLEFNGVSRLGDRLTLSFHEDKRYGSFWIELHEMKRDIVLLDYDPVNEVAKVGLGDAVREIGLKKASIGALYIPQVLSRERLSVIHKDQLEAIYGNEALLSARMEIVLAREEKEMRLREKALRQR